MAIARRKKILVAKDRMLRLYYLHYGCVVLAIDDIPYFATSLGEVALAMQLYEGAISGAKENLYLQEEALAHELTAEFYLSLGMVRFARLYMKEAHYCYSRWGAAAKVEDLSQRYPQLLTQTAVAILDTGRNCVFLSRRKTLIFEYEYSS